MRIVLSVSVAVFVVIVSQYNGVFAAVPAVITYLGGVALGAAATQLGIDWHEWSEDGKRA